MDLIFQVPMQYCSVQHQTLILSPVTSTAVHWFCFGSISSFYLELFLHWPPVAYWAPTDLGSSFSILSFCLFIHFMGFSRQEYWTGLPFPFPVDYSLTNSCEWKEVKSKGEKKRYKHLNAEFQRTARRDKKAILSDQRKETEENNRMGKTRDLFKKIRDTKGTFHATMRSIKDRNDNGHNRSRRY